MKTPRHECNFRANINASIKITQLISFLSHFFYHNLFKVVSVVRLLYLFISIAYTIFHSPQVS